MFGRRPVATSRWLPCDRLLAVAVAMHDLDLGAARLDPHDLDAAADVDAFARERVEHDRGAFRIFLAERRRRFEHRDLGAEPAERLRELEPDRPAADDDQMLGRAASSNIVSLVRYGVSLEPGNRRQRRRRAGRDHEAARLDLDTVADHDGVAILEARRALDHPHAEAGEALLGIVRRDRRDDAVDVRGDLGEIDVGRCAPTRRRLPPRAMACGALGGGDQRLRRHAAGS